MKKETPLLDDFMKNAHLDLHYYYHQYRKEDLDSILKELRINYWSIFNNCIIILEDKYPDGSDMWQLEIEECLLRNYLKEKELHS